MSIKSALSGVSVLAVAVAFILGTLFGETAKPVEKAPIEDVPVLAPLLSPCKTGWEYREDKVQDAISRRCERNEWTVWLNADGSFSHAWSGSGPFIYEPAAVEGWK